MHQTKFSQTAFKWNTLLIASILQLSIVACISAQDLHSPEPVQIVNSTQRLTVEQILSLIEVNQGNDALSQLQTLIDLPSTSLIESTHIQQAATQRVQPYECLSVWCQNKLAAILTSDEQRREYDQQWNAIADGALKSVQKNKNAREATAAVNRYRASSAGVRLAVMLADLQLEAGHALAATVTLHHQFSQLTRVNLKELNAQASDMSIPWPQAYSSCKNNPNLEQALAKHWSKVSSVGEKLTVDVYWRLLTAAAMQPDLLDYEGLRDWINVFAPTISDSQLRQRLTKLLEETEQWPTVRAISNLEPNNSRRFNLDTSAAWQSQLERWTSGNDLTPATRPAVEHAQPPVGQVQAALPYFPQFYDGKIFVHELNRIRAYNVENGRSWPSSNSPLFDSQINSAALIPLGYPLIGSPKAGLAIGEGCLYARIGSPVTAWISRSKSNDGSSFSSLIGLDLDRQGSLLPGFPLRLTPPQFQDAEFEGVPVILGQNIIVAVTERDNVGIRRSLAAFDRFSGVLVWRTAVLGSGVVVGSERANMMSSAQPFVAGGLIYFNTDLGSIACVDSISGETIWLSRYQRVHRVQSEYPRPNRYRYRDGNAAVVKRGLVYCMPQDCPELFALDACTGQLVWSTNESEVADCTYIAGLSGESLIVGGDRAVWLERNSGRVVSHFPAPGTPGTIHGLPQPRSLGRVAVVGDRVLMTTADRLYVFGADQTFSQIQQPDLSTADLSPAEQREQAGLKPAAMPTQPQILQQFSTRYCGSEGGNWAVDEQTLIIATPGRLICFRTEKQVEK